MGGCYSSDLNKPPDVGEPAKRAKQSNIVVLTDLSTMPYLKSPPSLLTEVGVPTEWGSCRLFANNPKIKEAFTNCDIKLQSCLFGKMVQSWMENLDNAGTLDQKVSGMCASHKKRRTTDMGLFKDALTELAGFVSDTVGMNGDQQTSWQKINEVILDIMKTKF